MPTAPFQRDNLEKASEVVSQDAMEDEFSYVSLIDEDKPASESNRSSMVMKESGDPMNKSLSRDTDIQESTVSDNRTDSLLDGIEISKDSPAVSRVQPGVVQEFPTILDVELAGNWLTKHIKFVIMLPSGEVIKRRFNDFIWLRSYLARLYIGAFIPPIPERLSVAFWPDGYLETRKCELQLFVKRGTITGFIANDKVWKIFFQDSRVAFDKTRKRWDKEHPPLSVRQTCEHLRKTFPRIINEPLPDIDEQELERQFETLILFVDETFKILHKINSSSKAMVESSVVKIDATMVMRENMAQYESILRNRFSGESRECKTRLMSVLQKTPRVVSKSWGSWCRVMQKAPSIHDVYLARNIKRNLMDFEVIRECITARAKVVKDLYAARNRALKWKNTELRSKDLSQKHADELRLEELEMLSRILYKLVTKQFLSVWQATQHRFSRSMRRFMGMQVRKYTQIKELWEASVTRLRREVPSH